MVLMHFHHIGTHKQQHVAMHAYGDQATDMNNQFTLDLNITTLQHTKNNIFHIPFDDLGGHDTLLRVQIRRRLINQINIRRFAERQHQRHALHFTARQVGDLLRVCGNEEKWMTRKMEKIKDGNRCSEKENGQRDERRVDTLAE
jgi:hypothetical protein